VPELEIPPLKRLSAFFLPTTIRKADILLTTQ
jgi:hypothetical protein